MIRAANTRCRLWLLPALLAATAACGDINGKEQPFAGMVNHCATGYHVPALVPPWVLVPVTDAPTTLLLVVPRSWFNSSITLDANDLTSATQTLQSIEKQARYFLQVEQVAGKAADNASRLLGGQAKPETIVPLDDTPVAPGGKQLCGKGDAILPQRMDAFIEFTGSQAAGKTIHFVFHAMPEASPLCDDAMIRPMILGTAPGGTAQSVCQ